MPDFDTTGQETSVIISFGAINGGMELVMQLVYDICKKFGKNPNSNPRFVYLDAFSLGGLEGSSAAPIFLNGKDGAQLKADFGKFQSNYWDSYFKYAMKYSKTMIFMVSYLWLRSEFCWQEYGWYKEWTEQGKDIKPIVVVFPDARPYMDDDNFTDRKGNSRSPKAMLTYLQSRPDYVPVNVATTVPVGNVVSLPVVKPSGKGPSVQEYRYQYDYTLSEIELTTILRNTAA